MEIAVMARLLAKGDVDVDTGHGDKDRTIKSCFSRNEIMAESAGFVCRTIMFFHRQTLPIGRIMAQL